MLSLSIAFMHVMIFRRNIHRYARVQIPRVTSWFTTRSYYHKYPISFILIGMAYLLLTSSYGIYIYERCSHCSPHSMFDG